jgi:hypothetical protein
MSTQNQLVVASDVTGVRMASWQIASQVLCGALVTQAIEHLRLPTTQADGGQVIYHAFDESSGELMPEDERLDALIRRYRIDAELRIRIVPELEAACHG